MNQETLDEYLEHAKTQADTTLLRGAWCGRPVDIKMLPHGYEPPMVEPLNQRLNNARLTKRVVYDEKLRSFSLTTVRQPSRR